MPPIKPGGGFDAKAFKALSGRLGKDYQAVKKGRDELGKSQKLSQEADKARLDRDINKMNEDLPSEGLFKFVFALAVLTDLLGLAPGFGWILDAITMGVMSAALRQPLVRSWWGLLTLLEFVPFIEVIPIYFFRVLAFRRANAHKYGTLKEFMKVRNKLAGRVTGAFAPILRFFFNFFIPIVSICLIAIVGFVVLSLATEDSGIYNPIGDRAVAWSPHLSAIKDSGAVPRFVDRMSISVADWNWQLDIEGWYNKFWEQSVVVSGGNHYTTTIEENQLLDMGLEISNPNFLAYYNKGDDLDFSFGVTGATFVDTNATPKCYIKKPLRLQIDPIANGTADPDKIIMTKGIPVSELVFCEGIKTTDLDPGYYQAFANVEYDFEVWSFIPYTFVSKTIFQTHGNNINTNLDIDRDTKSLSTNGPMVLAISELSSGIPQPYVVHEDRESNFLVDFKLENKQKGKLKAIDYVILQIPRQFEAKCEGTENKRWKQHSDEGKKILIDQIKKQTNGKGNTDFLEEYNIIYMYAFSEKDAKNDLLNFRCKLTLPVNEKFLDPGTKTTKTIVATAKYTYLLENMKSVEIKDPRVDS